MERRKLRDEVGVGEPSVAYANARENDFVTARDPVRRGPCNKDVFELGK